jgi:hypothetical protein
MRTAKSSDYRRQQTAKRGRQAMDYLQQEALRLASLFGSAIAHSYFLFFSSRTFGSQSSILLPSGSMIQANIPFS